VSVMVIGLVLSKSSLAAGERCTLDQHHEMQNEFRKCSRTFSNDSSLSPCNLVTNVVQTCGEEWGACHSSKEVRQMRDLHIEALVRQYGGEQGQELAQCPVVKEYRESGRAVEGGGEEIVCSDSQTLAIQQSFQNCSHEISTSVYEASLQMESTILLTGKLCKALTDIGTLCVKHLKECFARDDVIQMKRSSLAEMKDFLIRIVNGKVKKDALDDCKAGLDAVDMLEEYDEEDYTLTSSMQPEIIKVGKEDVKEEKSSAKNGSENVKEEEDAVDSATSEVVSIKEHRSVEEVTTKREGLDKVKNDEENFEEVETVEEKEEEVVRIVRPEKIRGRTASSSDRSHLPLLPLLLLPLLVNL